MKLCVLVLGQPGETGPSCGFFFLFFFGLLHIQKWSEKRWCSSSNACIESQHSWFGRDIEDHRATERSKPTKPQTLLRAGLKPPPPCPVSIRTCINPKWVKPLPSSPSCPDHQCELCCANLGPTRTAASGHTETGWVDTLTVLS